MTQERPEGIWGEITEEEPRSPHGDSPVGRPAPDPVSVTEDPSQAPRPEDELDLEDAEESSDIAEAEESIEPAAPEAAAAPEQDAGSKVEASPPEPEFNWYVLRVQSGREDTVSNNLRKKLTLTKLDHLVHEIVVPKQKVTEIKEGKRRIKQQKLFPGYIFIEMTLDDDLWYLIRDTSGIGDFVGSHQKPIPMMPNEVRKILNIMEEKEEVPEVKIDLVKNDQVKIKEGPFENFEGIVDEVNPGKGMVRVMVTIFGRETPVDLEYWQIEKI